ncbi:MAG: hypothetical protein ACKO3H_03430 [Verrucomicrobiota bacterium]
MRTRPPTPTSPVARGMVLVALVLLMGSLSWVRTFAVYTVAWLDGSHAPHVGLGPEGFQVILGHGRLHDLASEGGTSAGQHVHRWGARLLILLAHEEGPHSDHVVMLGSDGGPFETGRENRMASTPPKSSPDASPESGVVSPPAIARMPQGRFALGAPPSTTALSVQLRCTRLLI